MKFRPVASLMYLMRAWMSASLKSSVNPFSGSAHADGAMHGAHSSARQRTKTRRAGAVLQSESSMASTLYIIADDGFFPVAEYFERDGALVGQFSEPGQIAESRKGLAVGPQQQVVLPETEFLNVAS